MEPVSGYYQKAESYPCFADSDNLDKNPSAEMPVKSKAL